MQTQKLQMTDDVFYQKVLPTIPKRWQELFSKFSPYPSREEVDEKSGLVGKRTLANLDLKKQGIPNGRVIGKKMHYPKESVLVWLMSYSGETVSSEVM